MSDFSFELATPADDPAIRRLLANNPVPGRVTVTYEREPDYFLGCGPLGPFQQTIVARHQPSGQVVGLAGRTVRPLFINGRPEQVGYIGQLRVDPRYQGRWVVSGGFRFFHHLHADGRAAGYITTIIEGNALAEGVLVKKARRHFPRYQQVDRLCTLALILGRPGQVEAGPYRLERGSAAALPAIVAFLQQQGASKQFFPVYTQADFGGPLTLDFQIEDFILAYQQDELVGVLGLWDQTRYKQTRVWTYDGALAWLRPVYNLWLRLRGAQPLPPPGQTISFVYASFVCVAGNNPAIFRPLLQTAYNLAARRGYAYLMLGLSSRDPLLSVARSYPHIPYYSRLYTVCWADDLGFHDKLDGRLPYVEIAAL